MGWEGVATMLAVLTPLVFIPLTVIVFYLKDLREQQTARHADWNARRDVLDAEVVRLREEVTALRRDYATKEEWLRESMWARSRIERLASVVARSEAELEQLSAAPAVAERALRAVAALEQRLHPGHEAVAAEERG